MKTLTLKSFSFIGSLVILAFTPACGDTDDVSDAVCGEPSLGVTCQAEDGTCIGQVCSSGNWECPANTKSVALVPGNCAGPDLQECGEMPIGVTCQTSDRTCVAEQCVSGSWTCPSGTTPVGLAPGNCDGSSSPSPCGDRPMGVTCQTSDRTCVAEECISGSWTCPPDTTPVELAPGNCDARSTNAQN